MFDRVVASLILITGCVVLACGCHNAWRDSGGERMSAKVETGFVAKEIELDGKSYKYMVYVPEDYDAGKSWPAILFMHGAGERGSDGVKQSTVGIGKAIRNNPERFPCIVIMPQCPEASFWEGPVQELALGTLDAAIGEYNIDDDRIVLTGLSLGGFGTWSIGSRCAERFCALVPICGGGIPTDGERYAKTPIWCFHGSADPVVPVKRSQEMVQMIRAAGGNVEYTELEGVGHNSWDPAYGNPELIEWMLKQRRR